MELKVGDKVRWIGTGAARPKGTRGELVHRSVLEHEQQVAWEVGPTSWCHLSAIIKEFQPGDRVVLLKEQAPYGIVPGLLGRIVQLDNYKYDFVVEWDQPHSGAEYHLYRYADCYVDHHTSIARNTPILPPQPPPPPLPTHTKRGRCYRCAAPDSEMQSSGIRLCEYCKER